MQLFKDNTFFGLQKFIFVHNSIALGAICDRTATGQICTVHHYATGPTLHGIGSFQFIHTDHPVLLDKLDYHG
jgi:hypothetical protein